MSQLKINLNLKKQLYGLLNHICKNIESATQEY